MRLQGFARYGCALAIGFALGWAPVAVAENAPGLAEARAYWLTRDTIAWPVPDDASVRLHFSESAELAATATGLAGGDSILLVQKGVISGELADKYPHLSGIPRFELRPEDAGRVPEVLRSQFAVAATGPDGGLLAASGLQAAGVLDDLFAHDEALGVVFDEGTPSLRLWAPTARAVRLLLFDDSDPASGPARVVPEVLPLRSRGLRA